MPLAAVVARRPLFGVIVTLVVWVPLKAALTLTVVLVVTLPLNTLMLAVFWLADTLMLGGSGNAVPLLLVRVTVVPFEGAIPFSVTVTTV